MRLRLRLSQLQKVLHSEPLKLPITFKREDFTDKELSVLLKLLQQAE
ncbi:MAG: hypothetical protein KA210_06530 [Bacteroidia bacterium]|nr:hypothetical protein [Bacteroidia bacterium]